MANWKFDAQTVKNACNGMLEPEVYDEIYRSAMKAPIPVIVEVGTAHAAGTVSLASGLRDRFRKGKVITFEKIVGGSREQYGSVDENLKIITENISRFELEDFIEVVIGDVSDHSDVVATYDKLGLLFLDADGAIDRDFGLFYDRLIEGAPIIIDDILPRTRVKRGGRKGVSTRIKIDQKHRLGHQLLSLFRDFDLVDRGQIFGSNTWFGHRSVDAQFSDVPTEKILNAYRALTFTEATLPILPFRSQLGALLRTVAPQSIILKLKNIERGD